MKTLLAAALLAVALPAHAQTVRIGWLASTNEMVLARNDGSLEKALAAHGATLQWVGPFTVLSRSAEAINAGAIDITSGSSSSAIAAFAAQAPIQVFEYRPMAGGSEGLIVPDDSPIKTLADLAGKTVAVNRGGTGEYMLARALETAHVNPASVHKVYLDPPEGAPAYATKQIDCWSIWDPTLSVALQKYGGHVLAQGEAIGDDNANVFIVSDDFAAKHRDLLMVVYQTIIQQNQWSSTHKHEAGVIWARELHLPASIADQLGEHNAVPGGPVGPEQVKTFQRVSEWYVANKIVPPYQGMEKHLLDLEGK